MECLLFTFSIFERCDEQKSETVIIQHLWKRHLKKNSSIVKTYEGLTVNAKLPEQLFSFRPTDKLY